MRETLQIESAGMGTSAQGNLEGSTAADPTRGGSSRHRYGSYRFSARWRTGVDHPRWPGHRPSAMLLAVKAPSKGPARGLPVSAPLLESDL